MNCASNVMSCRFLAACLLCWRLFDVVHHEVAHAFALPGFMTLNQVCANEPVAGRLVGENPHDVGPAFNLFHQTFHDVGGIDAAAGTPLPRVRC